jgi:hypothetical protein
MERREDEFDEEVVVVALARNLQNIGVRAPRLRMRESVRD